MAISRADLEPRPWWGPVAGDHVIGVIDRIDVHGGQTKDGRKFDAYWLCGVNLGQPTRVRVWRDGQKVDEEHQYLTVPVRDTVLKGEFARENCEVGDQIGLMYLGEKQGLRQQVPPLPLGHQ